MDRALKTLKKQLGARLLKAYQPKIAIVDDEEANFSQSALRAARVAGYSRVERFLYVREKELSRLAYPGAFDICIFDIKGVVDPKIAKDGLQLAELVKRRSNCFVVITSAHQYHLDRRVLAVADHILEDRVLTTADFVSFLDEVSSKLSALEWRFYRKWGFKFAITLLRAT